MTEQEKVLFLSEKIKELNKIMFQECAGLESVDISKWDIGKCTSMYQMFYKCTNLKTVYAESIDVSNVNSFSYMFSGCNNLEEIDVSNWNVESGTSFEDMFYNCQKLTQLDVSAWNVKNGMSFRYMFYNCSNITELDVSDWNTGNATDLTGMFRECTSLNNIDLRKWDTSNVTSLKEMFRECESLEYLDLCAWDVENVTDISSMFLKCSNLKQIDIGRWNVSNVTNMKQLFASCKNLTSVDLGEWTVTKNTDVATMFYDCSSLKSINLQNFDFSKVKYYSIMFTNCDSLTVINAPMAVKHNITLPSGRWYDEDGNVVTILPLNKNKSVKLTKKVEYADELNLEINGFQIRNDATGIRTVYSVNDPENQVVDVGLIYGLCDYSLSTDMVVNSANDTVYSYEATENGKLDSTVSNYTGATSYTMTMMFGAVREDFYGAPTKVRAYALLEDGTYVYSDIVEYSVYNVANYLYQNSLSNNKDAHTALTAILLKVNSEMEKVTYKSGIVKAVL